MSEKATKLFDFPYIQKEKYNTQKAFVMKVDGQWQPMSVEEFINKANTVSRALLRLGVQAGDKIAVISTTNRTEWNIIDIAILQIGAQNVPIYPTITPEEYAYIFNHAETSLCFVSDEELYNKTLEARKDAPVLKDIYTFDKVKDAKHWEELLILGADDSNQDEVEARKDAVQPDDLATLIYTSGTTGLPKGVMLTHHNIVTNVIDSMPRLPIEFGKSRALSFLPVCHIFERMLHYLYMNAGVSIYFAESIDKIGENIKEVKPNLMSAVPRLLEKIFDSIMQKGAELSGIKKALFFWAVNLGLKYEPYGANGWWYEKQLALANKLIFSKWREALGGELKTIVSGSAALQPRLARVFTAAGIPIMEGYGLTETSPVVSVNMMKDRKFKIGTVGPLIDNVEVKIAEDGEILVKGPNVMKGYYKDPERTAEVIKDGWFHTGDKGELDEDGFLKITGRKKEIFKTSGGKYVSPALLENEMKKSRFIEQIMVVGEGEKMPAALIQPDFNFVKEWAKRHQIKLGESLKEIAENEKVIQRIQEEVDHYNGKFAKWEKIKKFALTPEVWSIENNLLTPTMKMKRKQIKQRFIDLYNSIYGHES